jgi:hypothetical protein
MQRPSPGLRAQVAEEADSLETEDDLDDLLKEIGLELERASPKREPTGEEPTRGLEHTAVLEWASIVSYAVARYYAPASPWKPRKAGWDPRIASRLQWFATVLRLPLSGLLAETGAESYGISVGFPWGISVGLSWTKPQPDTSRTSQTLIQADFAPRSSR